VVYEKTVNKHPHLVGIITGEAFGSKQCLHCELLLRASLSDWAWGPGRVRMPWRARSASI